jgi:hypothetical protein
VGFSQHGVVYLDEQVEKHDARVLQNGAPRGPQQCVGEIAAFGRGQDFKLDELPESWFDFSAVGAGSTS